MEKFSIKLIMMTLAPFRNAAVVGLIRRWQLQMLQLHLESLKCCASLIQILIPSHAIQLGQNHRMLWNIGHKVMYVLCVLFAVLFRFSTFPRISIPPRPFRHCELKYLISLRLPHTHSKKTQERRLRDIQHSSFIERKRKRTLLKEREMRRSWRKKNIYVAFLTSYENPLLPSFDMTSASWNASFYFAPRACWQAEEDEFPREHIPELQLPNC